MKLGQKVTFSTDYIKTGDCFNPERMKEFFFEEDWERIAENGYTLTKLAERNHVHPKVGIVVGKRRFALETRFEYVECTPYERGEWRWQSQAQPQETFYLVACRLDGFHKVKASDLSPFMIEDPIEGLIDE